MSEVNVAVRVGQNTYDLLNTDGDNYAREVSAPLQTSSVTVSAQALHGNIVEMEQIIEITPEWQVPKTNWTADDYFNYWDYNRITNNIFFLNRFMRFLFLPFDIIDMGEDKDDGYKSMIYAREFNAIEENLQTINQKTYALEIGEKKTWQANRPTPTYEDFNRIESSCLKLYEQAMVDYEALTTLAFTLGGEEGIKV